MSSPSSRTVSCLPCCPPAAPVCSAAPTRFWATGKTARRKNCSAGTPCSAAGICAFASALARCRSCRFICRVWQKPAAMRCWCPATSRLPPKPISVSCVWCRLFRKALASPLSWCAAVRGTPPIPMLTKGTPSSANAVSCLQIVPAAPQGKISMRWKASALPETLTATSSMPAAALLPTHLQTSC